ncbi:hypothetical protein [Mycolicibacterium vinylchloridicum]|uniref:hypothetical protein n=1 Tax=Mycolicibacterium vinylchloridicum TaxID=2736928 RepID=UPI0015C884C3|nr:hypothetical protein [Mycolicibacterium vinylchloridicum]
MSKWMQPGTRFNLARAVQSKLNSPSIGTDASILLRQFDVDPEPGDSWTECLIEAGDDKLAEVAKHFGLEPPEPPEAEAQGEIDPSAADIDAYAELVSAETALRDVIRAVVPDWIEQLDPEAVAKLEAKRTEEDKRRDGIAVSKDLLDYTEIYQLKELISRNWDPAVKSILDDKKRTDVYLDIILDVRNAVGHPRPVYASERLLLAGAAGQIRNQLAAYRSKSSGPEAHYPSIDSARDSGGREGHKSPRLVSVSSASLADLPRLNVGDTIIFELEATDPRNRDLWWRMTSMPNGEPPSLFKRYPPLIETVGNRVTASWTVDEDDVGEYRQIVVALASTGRYHREGEWDDGVIFHYHVNPPPDA